MSDTQTEIDALKQELRMTQKLLDDTKGRVKAVELDSYEVKRNAKQATEQAEALKAETEAALTTASDQMRMAHAVACGIYGMAELARAFMARKVSAARVVHREMKQMEQLQSFIDATTRNDQSAIKAVTERAKQTIAAVKADGEAARNKAYEYALAYGFKNFENTFQKLVTEGEAT